MANTGSAVARNLDPDAYSLPEMCNLLGIAPGAPRAQVEEARDTLARQLRAAGSVDPDEQSRIALFLDSITSRILNAGGEGTRPKDGLWSQPYTPITEQGSNIIITNPDTIAGRDSKVTGGREANSGAAPPGYLNPINVRTLQQAVNIDSRFRPNYFTAPSTDFVMELPEVQRKVVSLRVGSMELPLTFYAISESQGNAHMLVLGETATDASGVARTNAWLVRLPDGNYEQSWSRNSRAAHIERAMNNAIARALPCEFDETQGITTAATATVGAPKLTFQVDRASGRSLLAVAGDDDDAKVTSVLFNISVRPVSTRGPPGNRFMQAKIDTATNLQLRLGWQLGFRAARYSIGAQLGTPWPDQQGIVSESPCHISGPRYGLLSIDDHQRNASTSFTVAFGESSLDSNIISRINLAPSLSGDGVYQSIDAPGLTTTLNRTREYFGPVDIQRLHVRLLDEYGRVISLNGCDWSFSLAFEKLYD